MSLFGQATCKKLVDPSSHPRFAEVRMKPTTTFFLPIAVVLGAATASAASISVNLSKSTAANSVINSFPYGVEASSVWNQQQPAGDVDVLDDSNVTTTLDWTVGNPSEAFVAETTYDNTVFRFGDSAFATADALTVSQIPYDDYKIIVYMAGQYNGTTGDPTTVQGSVSLGATTFFYAPSDPANTSFIEITDTSSAGTPVAGNYAVFDNLSGNSQIINWARDGGTGGPAILTGFQVVQVPEPDSLLSLGVAGLLLVGRRRRA